MDIWREREEFIRELVAYRKKAGLTNESIAEQLGLSLHTLKGYLYRDTHRPSMDVLQKASAIFGVSVTKFIDDPGGTPYDDQNGYPVPKLKLRLCAGNGEVATEFDETVDEVYFVSSERIHQKLKVNPKHLRYFVVDGDSMEPYLLDGDRVLVDIDALEKGFRSGVWVLRTGDEIAIKRVQKIGTQHQASSDNTVYPPFILDESCKLLGRVVSLERDF